jgi:hypothetical protein
VVVRRVAIVLTMLAVAGCGHYEWRRLAPNATAFPQAEYSCQRDSLQVAPVAVVREVERTKREERVTARDVNEGNRESLFYSCMRAHGWAHVFIKDDANPATAAPPVPPPAVAVAPPPPAPAPAAPRPAAVGPFDPSGVWRIDDGDKMTLRLQPGGVVQGEYGDGTLSGRLTGHHFEGTWREASGDRACRRTADGVYWGRVSFEFAPDGRHVKGRWGYCDDDPRKQWDADR